MKGYLGDEGIENILDDVGVSVFLLILEKKEWYGKVIVCYILVDFIRYFLDELMKGF